MRGLAGKAILVTGSSTGIGYAMAERLIAEGAHVLIHGRDRGEVDAAVSRLGPLTAGATGDLAEPETAQAIVDATVAAFGRIDGLVNNAGIYPRGVLGERLWLARDETPVPAHHRRAPNILSAIGAAGVLLAIGGLAMRAGWAVIAGVAVAMLAKLWFIDRMVWLHRDMTKERE